MAEGELGSTLAVTAGGVAGVRHQLRRYSNDPLAGAEQVGLQASGQVPAVLHRPRPVRAEPVGPSHQLQVIGVVVAVVVLTSSCRPSWSTATTVCVRLRASIPRITIYVSPFRVEA
jgi:hypothetical protein